MQKLESKKEINLCISKSILSSPSSLPSRHIENKKPEVVLSKAGIQIEGAAWCPREVTVPSALGGIPDSGEGRAGHQSTGWLRRMSTSSGDDVGCCAPVGAAPESVLRPSRRAVVTMAVQIHTGITQVYKLTLRIMGLSLLTVRNRAINIEK